uniref:Uncharacterized protein n=1 Tax=Kalanchoe fedtschenkoi TaxID=63787 RepID=A0A7N0UNE6_KALFE
MTEVEKKDTIGLQIPKTDKKKSVSFPVLNSPTPKNADTQMWEAHDPRGVDIPMKQPNYMANSELHSRRQWHGLSWADRDYMDSRFTRSFGYHSPPDPFCAERYYRDTGLVGRFGVDPPPGDSNWFDRKYRDERFSGSFRGSPPRNSSWADGDFRGDRFSRSLGVSSPSPNYLSRSYSIQMSDGPLRDFPPDHHLRRSPVKWRSWSPYHSPRDHLPFSFSQPHDPPVFTTQTCSHRHLHNSY